MSLNRRSFLKVAGLAAACASFGLPNDLFAARPRWVISCRDVLLSTFGAKTCWEAMDKLEITAVEAQAGREFGSSGFFHDEIKYNLDTDAGLLEFRKDLRKQKKRISAFLMANQLDGDLKAEMKYAEKVVNACQVLGVQAIRIDVYPSTRSKEEFAPVAVEACKQLCSLVKGTKIRYAIENHGSVTNDPEFLGNLFDKVGSDHLGLTLDTANFYWYGHPLEKLYDIFGKFIDKAYHTHCKSIKYPEDKRNTERPMGWEYGKYAAPIDQGDIDFRRVAEMLKAAKYKGDMCLENEIVGRLATPEERFAELKREIDYLKNVCAL